MIEQLIDKQDGFQQVRARIAEILATESLNQQQLAINAGLNPFDWELDVFEERANPIELFRDSSTQQQPVINVWFDSAAFPESSSQLVNEQTATGQFNIDCFARGLSAETAEGHTPGDADAQKRAQNAAMLCRNILMAGQYLRLGFEPNELVSSRMSLSLNSFQAQFNNESSVLVGASRFVLKVRYNETSQTAAPVILEEIGTIIERQSDGRLLARADFST